MRVRRLALSMAMIALLLIPTAALAEDAMPGDLLYPVKQVTERVRAVFDRGVEARHRVEEVEILVRTEQDVVRVEERIRIAEDAVGGGDGDLVRRLEQVREEHRRRLEGIVDRSPHPDLDQPGERATTTTAPNTPTATAPGVTTTMQAQEQERQQERSDQPPADENSRNGDAVDTGDVSAELPSGSRLGPPDAGG